MLEPKLNGDDGHNALEACVTKASTVLLLPIVDDAVLHESISMTILERASRRAMMLARLEPSLQERVSNCPVSTSCQRWRGYGHKTRC